MKFFALPTWLLYQIARPAMKDTHPFKRNLTLERWSRSRTELCVVFDIVFWGQFVSILLFFFLRSF